LAVSQRIAPSLWLRHVSLHQAKIGITHMAIDVPFEACVYHHGGVTVVDQPAKCCKPHAGPPLALHLT
jgi:hypothetical protein